MNKRYQCVLGAILWIVGAYLPAYGQDPTPAPPDPSQILASALLPPVDTANLPGKIWLAGAGIRQGAPSGFVNLLVHAAGPVYAAFATDFLPGRSEPRAGIETIVARPLRGDLALTVKGMAGGALAVSSGGSYGVGGSAIYQLRRLGHPELLVAFSVMWDTSNIAQTNATAAGWKQMFSGTTFRIGFGRRSD